MGRYVRHQPCEKCGSSDGCAVYEDGSTYCWVCHKSSGGKRQTEAMSQRDWTGSMNEIAQLPSANMLARGIDEAVAARYGVKVEYDGSRNETAYYFPLYTNGVQVGYQKKAAKAPGLRGKKDTARIGETSGCDPFGAQVAGAGGKFVIVTEGAEDALAMVQMLKAEGKSYRVVSTLGTDGWRRSLEYFERFEKVCICYDQDQDGRVAAEEFASALSYGKPAIARWEPSYGEDPNAMLVNRQGKAMFNAIMSAKPYEASGIVFGEEIWNRMQDYSSPDYICYPPEFAGLNEKMIGLRAGEISTWIAGSSIGKTSFIRRIKQHALHTPASTGELWRIGEVELEERGEKTWRGLMQFHAGSKWFSMNAEERRRVYEETYGTGRIFTVDNGLDAKARKGGLLGKFKHLHYDKGCRLFFLDHITLGVREFGDRQGSLSDQDEMMEQLLGFVESTNSHMCLISHLRKPPGGTKTWSQGAVPTEEDMKGSGSLYQISADIIACARDKTSPDDYVRNTTELHTTKCRETGDTGPADRLYWEKQTGTLVPAALPAATAQDGDAPL